MRSRRFSHILIAALLIGILVAPLGCGLKLTLTPTPAGPVPLIAQRFAPEPEEPPPMEELDTLWGPYLAEREWGNPREAVKGDGWGFSYRMATNTAYRYGEDGIAGLADLEEIICFSFAFWDEKQPYVTERLYGFTNPEGEYGEDIQEERTFWENTPAHSYMGYQYVYPFQERTFSIEIIYAKRSSQTIIAQVEAENIGAETATLHVLPEVWFRRGGAVEHAAEDIYTLTYPGGSFVALSESVPDGWQIASNADGLKGAINRAMVEKGALSNSGEGNKAAWDFRLPLKPGEVMTLRFALANAPNEKAAKANTERALGEFDRLLALRREEADALYRDVAEHEEVYRYALMNLLWNKMYYEFDGSFQPIYRGKVDLHDVVLVPDKWEFPWPAMWDTCFQAKVATLADVELAKGQLRLFLSDRWQIPTGHVPNCEWDLMVETPPLFAWAAWEIFQRDGDEAFLREMFPRLEKHYLYCWRGLDLDHDRLYKGGFMGLDNIPRPQGFDVEQADASGWMAFFARRMALIAGQLGHMDKAKEYREDYERIKAAINEQLWNEEDGFYYDRSYQGHLREKSYVGLIPFIAGAAEGGRAERIIEHLRNRDEFWSPFGIRSLSKDSKLYEPGYSRSGWKNSNWRGSVWLPINYLLVQALADHDPALAEELRENLIETVEREWGRTGHFFEYYHAETGEGLGADHQTGWTALVANLIEERWRKP